MEYMRLRAIVMAEEAACYWCGVEAQASDQCDHEIPLSRGGRNVRANLHRSCRRCNMARAARNASANR